ncbi:MAG TPA: hypothetical protein VK084_02080, partial [Chitinophagaceae bacterium]|nr:hypothetical protein [Chitinophagaceae bacterium]
MEILILLCLLIIIFLLLADKVDPRKQRKGANKEDKVIRDIPDIMGKTKPLKRQSMPKPVSEYQSEKDVEKADNFEVEINEKEVDIQIPQEELEDVFDEMPDLEEEEEEWNRQGQSEVEDGLAQGVTFEELSTVGMLLQKEKLVPSQKETAVAIVQKIDGTELFDLLESSMEGASKKIAQLLD